MKMKKKLTFLCSSKLRTIRYGTAETLSNIFKPVIELLVSTTDAKTRQELHKNNRAASPNKKDGEFEKSGEELSQQMQRLGKLTDIILKDFLKKRYEDVMPEIRVTILELLVILLKEKFLFIDFSLDFGGKEDSRNRSRFEFVTYRKRFIDN